VDLFDHLWRLLTDLKPSTLRDLFDFVGIWLYVILFLIIFAETGLVVTPFLPGDSLLFALGFIAATTALNIPILLVVLCAAAIIGDAVNYSAGYWIGPKVFSREDSWLLNRKHLMEAHRFYEKHGGKTIVIARFVPIIRTFAPFVAGIGKMSYFHFAMFNVTGGIAWVVGFVMGGYLAATGLKGIASEETIEKYFKYIILVIIVLSVLPVVIEILRARRRAKAANSAPAADGAPAKPIVPADAE
jgi:membrane-associated protein